LVLEKKTFEHYDMFTTIAHKRHSSSRITIHCRSLHIHGCLVSVLGISTGFSESEMLSSELCSRPSGKLPAGQKPGSVKEV
jgi:hypothetical protein